MSRGHTSSGSLHYPVPHAFGAACGYCNRDWPCPGATSRRKHLVDAVHFEHGEADSAAPVECICGWAGVVADWAGHRRIAAPA